MIRSIDLEEPADKYSCLLGEVEIYKSKGWDLYGILSITQPGGQNFFRATLSRFES